MAERLLRRIFMVISGVIFLCSFHENISAEESDHESDEVVEAILNLPKSSETALEDNYPPFVIEELADPSDPEPWEADNIVIDKGAFTLKVYDTQGKLRMKFPVGVGVNYGNKQRRGDNRTPEGAFTITSIQLSTVWTHDFGDGKGVISGCYGPYFIRLKTPITTEIGIHGTHLPESIGTRCTEGCIRLNNKDLIKLKEKVRKGMLVRILPGLEDERANRKAAMGNIQ